MNLRIMQFIKCFDYFCFNYAPLATPLLHPLGERVCGLPRLLGSPAPAPSPAAILCCLGRNSKGQKNFD